MERIGWYEKKLRVVSERPVLSREDYEVRHDDSKVDRFAKCPVLPKEHDTKGMQCQPTGLFDADIGSYEIDMASSNKGGTVPGLVKVVYLTIISIMSQATPKSALTPSGRSQEMSSGSDSFVSSAVVTTPTRGIRPPDTPMTKARGKRMDIHAKEKVSASSVKNKDAEKVFEGVVAFIDVVINYVDYGSTIELDIVKGGGKRAKTLNSAVTHFIYDNGRTINWEAAKKLPNLKTVNSAWYLDCDEKRMLLPTDDPKYVAKYVPPVFNLRDYMTGAKRRYIRKVETLHKTRSTPRVRSTQVQRRDLIDGAHKGADKGAGKGTDEGAVKGAGEGASDICVNVRGTSSAPTTPSRKAVARKVNMCVTPSRPSAPKQRAGYIGSYVRNENTIHAFVEKKLERQFDSIMLKSPSTACRINPVMFRQKLKGMFEDGASWPSSLKPLFTKVAITGDAKLKSQYAKARALAAEGQNEDKKLKESNARVADEKFEEKEQKEVKKGMMKK